MIQVRDVPESVCRILKSRAAREGMSLSKYVRRELERAAERPTMQEWLNHTQRAKPIRGKATAAKLMRRLRGD
ncbi:MAG: FitA-like ribbon-helix-helix domain-containing protein [Bryobacteraceae bacterium]